MRWLGQLCALHALPPEGRLLQGATRSLASRQAANISNSSRRRCRLFLRQAAEARSAGVGLLSGGQVQQLSSATEAGEAPLRGPQRRARLWQAGRSLHCLLRGSPLQRPVGGFCLSTAAASLRLADPRCKEGELLLLLLLSPGVEAADSRPQLPKIALQAAASDFPAGGGVVGGNRGSSSLVGSQKDAGGFSENEPQDPGKKPNKSQQLKKVFKEYGAVGVSFHVGISLMSLGMFYLAVSSGVDMTALLFKLGFDEAFVQSKLATGTSTFVLAYAVHKLFAPVRISITLVSVPLLVRYFRKIGFFKPPAPNP
ncbi:protein FAM210B, mitochondrial [Hemicordylus capensis]|uniref:protein FAM210B, mitochondrial n=1 Tax=Hemicordylus capensis TaxID=884348 RepID=UPI0023023ACF|nr:protein FAM210B, mitochondrial [Hemicordylus capensis]